MGDHSDDRNEKQDKVVHISNEDKLWEEREGIKKKKNSGKLPVTPASSLPHPSYRFLWHFLTGHLYRKSYESILFYTSENFKRKDFI